MRILFLAPHLSTGGMPQFLLKRIELLKKHTKHEIYVVEYQCYSMDFVVQRDAIKSLLGENFFTLYEDKMALMKVISDFKPDVIHIDEMSERLDRDMVKAMYNNGREYRIVETCHDISFVPSEKIFKPDLYLFCTPYHVDTFGVSNYKVIEYPIDDNHTGIVSIIAAQTRLNMYGRTNVLNVGLWTKGKNQGEGIEIARKYPHMDFHFVGNQAGNFADYWQPLMKDLPKNVKVWGERHDIDDFMKSADIFMFNSTWECNPLVLREAIGYGLPIIAHNLPQYKDMFTKYIQPIDTDLNTIRANYDVPTDNTSPWFMAQHDLAYQDVISCPIVQQEVSITQYFVNQPFLEINCPVDENFFVQFFEENGRVIYENTIKSNSWIRLNRQWFTKWKTKITCRETVIYNETLNFEGKRVLIVIDSDSLGDNLAWVPYCLEFQRKHKCKVIVSTNKTDLFDYPELEFVGRGSIVDNIHGQYNIGWYYNADKEPEVCNTITLQKTATNILGLEYKEIRPVLKFKSTELQSKTVTIATNSTAGCKFWTREGWQAIVNYLTENGYKVINVSKEKNPLDNCAVLNDTSMENTMRVIDESEFFIGLSSGLSWLAWALQKRVIMISNFTEDGHEFSLDTLRVTNPSVCHGCWNNGSIKFDRSDWDWCPFHKGTPRQFECHTSITADMVISKIKQYIYG